jgi:hypothetical protein
VETLLNPTTSSPPLQDYVFSPNNEPSSYPNVIQQDSQSGSHPKDSTKTIKKPTGKKLRGSVDLNFKNKRAGHLISRCARNKMKPHADTINTIELSEDSDSNIQKFLAEEDPISFGLYPNRPYDYVNNLPPCLKDNPKFLGIQLCDKPTIRMEDSPIHNVVSANANSLESQCDECRSWIDRYYTDVPLLVGSQPIFFRLLSKAAYTPCRITTNHCRIVLMDIRLIFTTITIQFRPSFHNCKCENTSFVD